MSRLPFALSVLVVVACSEPASNPDASSNDDAASGVVDAAPIDAVSIDAFSGIKPYTCTTFGTEALYHFDGDLEDECRLHPLDGANLFGPGWITGNSYGGVATSQEAFPHQLPLMFEFWYRSKAGAEGVVLAIQSLGVDSEDVFVVSQTVTHLVMTVHREDCETPWGIAAVPVPPPTDEYVHIAVIIQGNDGNSTLSVLGKGANQIPPGPRCATPTDPAYLHIGGLPGEAPHADIEELRVSNIVKQPHIFP